MWDQKSASTFGLLDLKMHFDETDECISTMKINWI